MIGNDMVNTFRRKHTDATIRGVVFSKQSMLKPGVCGIGQGEFRHREYERLKVCGSQAYDLSVE
jgi:hypothetical protein